MLGKYTPASIKQISGGRTKKVLAMIKRFGGELQSMYVLLGEFDLAFIVNFPDNKEAMKASVALNRLIDVSFSSFPAIPVEEFDVMVSEME